MSRRPTGPAPTMCTRVAESEVRGTIPAHSHSRGGSCSRFRRSTVSCVTEATPAGLTILPANEAGCDDLQTVFGARGAAAYCQCQRYKLRRREAFAKFPVEERAHRLREQTNCGRARSATTSGLVAFLDDAPVGWCAVEPRSAYEGLARNNRVPWEGRTEDKADDSVWAVTCVFARAGFRRRGIAHALVRAAVDHARERGARAIEGTRCSRRRARRSAGTRSTSAAASSSPPPLHRDRASDAAPRRDAHRLLTALLPRTG